MKSGRLIFLLAALVVALTGSGCFRVGSNTQALRDAALENGFSEADEKIEVGVGFFTVGLAKIAAGFAGKYADIPPEARLALSSLKHAECAVYEVRGRQGSLAAILEDADKAMEARGCERLVGVIERDELVAVYVPRDMTSARNVQASVLVLDRNQLVCVTARANAEDLLQLALNKVRDELPPEHFAARW